MNQVQATNKLLFICVCFLFCFLFVHSQLRILFTIYTIPPKQVQKNECNVRITESTNSNIAFRLRQFVISDTRLGSSLKKKNLFKQQQTNRQTTSLVFCCKNKYYGDYTMKWGNIHHLQTPSQKIAQSSLVMSINCIEYDYSGTLNMCIYKCGRKAIDLCVNWWKKMALK